MAAAKKKKSGVSVVDAAATRKERLGAIVLQRFSGEKAPASLAPSLNSFAKAQSALETATSAITKAHSFQQNAVSEVKVVDRSLTLAIEDFASALVGSGMGPRKTPFASFSRLVPSKLARFAYARKIAAVRAIVQRLRARDLPAPVRKALETLSTRADAVAEALGGITGPASGVHKAQQELVPVLATWRKAYARLKIFAAVAWIDEPAAVRAMFEKPDRRQVPTRRRRRDV